MGLIRPSVLILALLMASPALYQYFVAQDLDITDTLGRYLLAVPIAAVMLAFLRMLTAGYGKSARAGSLDLTGQPAPAGAVVQPEPIHAQPN